MKKVFDSINLDIPEVESFIEEQGLSFVCNGKMQVEASEEDFETLLERFPFIDYVEAEAKSLQDIADENDLLVVETTSSRNGYPSNLRKAITGFSGFEEAKRIASENGLTLVWLDSREGWKLWHRGDTATEPMTITSNDFGDDYNFEDNSEEIMQCAYDVIADLANQGASFDDIRSYMAKVEKITDAIEKADYRQVVVTYKGEYYDTIEEHPIYFHFDSKYTQLAAIES